MPICAETDLPVGAERPVRAQLLDERLVAFRDGQNRLGLIYGLCPHARGDMFYSSIDDDGIRCNYHGWKFDIHGACLETPMHPDGSAIDTIAFPLAVHAGLIWGYLGEGDPPALPEVPSVEGIQAERRTKPWIETVVSELTVSSSSGIAVESLEDAIRVTSGGASVAQFVIPGIITRADRSSPTLVLPASEKASALFGGISDTSAGEHEAGAAIRAAVEQLLQRALTPGS